MVVVAAIATAVVPVAVASASSHQASHKTVSLSGGQSVSVTCSGKSLSVTKSGNGAVLVCASRTVKVPVSTPPDSPSRNNSRLDAAAEEAVAEAKQYLSTVGFLAAGPHRPTGLAGRWRVFGQRCDCRRRQPHGELECRGRASGQAIPPDSALLMQRPDSTTGLAGR